MADQSPTASPILALHLRLPATSANLGPGFDALGLALSLHLTIDACLSGAFEITATGRNPELCASLSNNLILMTYTEVLGHQGLAAPPLRLHLHNEIPLGMGCGSSAAALLAGVLLANHFGQLAWSPQQVLDEACSREGHPDNVAACFHGGLTVSSTVQSASVEPQPTTLFATLGQHLDWALFLALPVASLATAHARALLPPSYSRPDAVANVQATALLVAAFALNRPELLAAAMRDRLHQPFRASACPLLPALLPLAGHDGVHGVALSGAGPAVLLLADPQFDSLQLRERIQSVAGPHLAEILELRIATGATLK